MTVVVENLVLVLWTVKVVEESDCAAALLESDTALSVVGTA